MQKKKPDNTKCQEATPPYFFIPATISKISESYVMSRASQYLVPSNSKHIQSIKRGVTKCSLKVRWVKNPDETDTGCQA